LYTPCTHCAGSSGKAQDAGDARWGARVAAECAGADQCGADRGGVGLSWCRRSSSARTRAAGSFRWRRFTSSTPLFSTAYTSPNAPPIVSGYCPNANKVLARVRRRGDILGMKPSRPVTMPGLSASTKVFSAIVVAHACSLNSSGGSSLAAVSAKLISVPDPGTGRGRLSP